LHYRFTANDDILELIGNGIADVSVEAETLAAARFRELLQE